MKAGKFLALGLVLSVAAGCAPAGFEVSNTDLIVEKPGSNGSSGGVDDNGNSQKVCKIDTTDHAINLHVQSFEMVDKIRGSVGFDFAQGILGSIGLTADIQSGRLETRMDLLRPMDLGNAVGSELETTKRSKREFGFKLNAGKWKAEAGYIYTTPIGKMTKEAIKANFANLMKTAAKDDQIQPWATRVIKVIDDQHIVIAAGSNSGLKEGDLLDLTNATDQWEDNSRPCESQYYGPLKLSAAPIAQYKAVTVYPETTMLRLENEKYQVELGAIAELAPTKEQKKRKMRRSVKLNQVTSRKIVIEGLGTVDVLDHMLNQIDPVLRDQGYYLKKQ